MDITKDEALAIISKTDPRHEAFYGGDKATVDGVNGAFSRSHPESVEIGSGLPVLLEEELNDELKPTQPQAPQTQPPAETTQDQVTFGPEWDFTPEQADEQLRRDWDFGIPRKWLRCEGRRTLLSSSMALSKPPTTKSSSANYFR